MQLCITPMSVGVEVKYCYHSAESRTTKDTSKNMNIVFMSNHKNVMIIFIFQKSQKTFIHVLVTFD